MSYQQVMRQSIVLCELGPSDAHRYNAFLAEALRRHPLTLRISPEDVSARPFETTAASDRVTIVAQTSETWLGVGSLEREQGRTKRSHIAWLVRMIVAQPDQGIGRLILRELKRRALEMPGVEKVNLTVAADNPAAIHLYESEGFIAFSREPDAFRDDGTSVTELSMSWIMRGRQQRDHDGLLLDLLQEDLIEA
jgi:ribosomal protein S18 acetylase RimI-like enzyme